jgi:cytochrome c oxidase subunit III
VAVPDTKIRVPPRGPAASDADRGQRPPRVPPPPARNGDGEGRPERGGPFLSNARLGMLMLLCGESMFFGGLVIAFLDLRVKAAVWPPPGQPRLPVGLTAVNTLVLLASSYTMTRALAAARAGDHAGLLRRLGVTWGLGALFLAVQGMEWVRLVGFGLRMSSGVYGATFYTLVGIHGVHVLGAVTWLLVVLWLAAGGRYRHGEPTGLQCCAMYWHFVVVLWPILYFLVYLA